MAEYLKPTDTELTTENRRRIFEIRIMMVDISSNFLSSEENEHKCVCQKSENMEHIYYCETLNSNKLEEMYEQIFNGSLDQQIAVFQRFEEIFENRRKILEKLNESNHEIHNSDPLYSDLDCNEYGMSMVKLRKKLDSSKIIRLAYLYNKNNCKIID